VSVKVRVSDDDGKSTDEAELVKIVPRRGVGSRR
jgi:hypothetical protein